jgi:hypothetical protein
MASFGLVDSKISAEINIFCVEILAQNFDGENIYLENNSKKQNKRVIKRLLRFI